jgi:hypothetical protein
VQQVANQRANDFRRWRLCTHIWVDPGRTTFLGAWVDVDGVQLGAPETSTRHHRGVIPDFVTHYHLPDRLSFLNLSDLDEPHLTDVMAELMYQRKEARQHRLFGRTYMKMRHLVQARLYRLFVQAGGRPERSSPHYFILGESPWFRGLAVNMQDVRLPLTALPHSQTSVTYPDSFAAMEVGPAFDLPHEHRPYHGQVFRLDELPDLIATYGLPVSDADDDYTGYERRTAEKYIEVQLWSDEPVRTYLDRRR